MVTSIKQQDFKQTALRISRELHAQLHAAASLNGRSYNAEIVARLQGSFDFMASLPPVVREAVADKLAVSKDGCTAIDVLTNLVLAGQSNGGQVLNIRIAPGMTIKEVHTLLTAMVEDLPDATLVTIERE